MSTPATSVAISPVPGPGDDAAELDGLARGLADSLAAEEDLRGSTRLLMRPPAPGEQGALAAAVEVAGVVGPYIAPVAGAICFWLAQRVRSRRVTLTLTRGSDGAALTLSAGSAEDAHGLLPVLQAYFSGAPVPGTAPAPGSPPAARRTDPGRPG